MTDIMKIIDSPEKMKILKDCSPLMFRILTYRIVELEKHTLKFSKEWYKIKEIIEEVTEVRLKKDIAKLPWALDLKPTISPMLYKQMIARAERGKTISEDENNE